jgi:acyl carrier protein
MNERIREILRRYGRLSVDVESIADETDLYQSGMASHATVSVMLALESTFGVEFPDHMLRRGVFESIASIQKALSELDGATRLAG